MILLFHSIVLLVYVAAYTQNRKIRRAGGITFGESFLRNGKGGAGERFRNSSPLFIPKRSQTESLDDRDWPAANPTFDSISHVDVLDC